MNFYNIRAIFFIVSISISVIKLISRFMKQRKRNSEIAVKAEDKLREEALDRAILNSVVPNSGRKIQAATPIAVSYDPNKVLHGVRKKGENARQYESINMVRLVENSELSAREYVLNPRKGISIGSSPGMNDVIIQDNRISDKQCEIIEYDNKIYIRNIGRYGNVMLYRRKNKTYIDPAIELIEVRNKDVLVVGNVWFKVYLCKMKNTVKETD